LLSLFSIMKRSKESLCIEYRITDKQIMRDLDDAFFPINIETSCAGILGRLIGCGSRGPSLRSTMEHARWYLKADAWEYHHSIEKMEHVFRFHLPNAVTSDVPSGSTAFTGPPHA